VGVDADLGPSPNLATAKVSGDTNCDPRDEFACHQGDRSTAIDQLQLKDADCRHLREQYVTDYLSGDVSFSHIKRRAPFIAIELRRQRKLHKSDL
jgi:hypothetical protein